MPIDHGISRSVALSLAIAAAAVGCGGDPGRLAVRGTVTLDDKPLESGTISFLPQADGPAASTSITSGSYAIRAADGPKPGPYSVEIRSIRSTGKVPSKPVDPDYAVEETIDLIPPRYNRESTLRAEVKTEGPNSFDFALESASAKGARPRGGR